MTYSVLESWFSSSGDRRVITRRIAVTLATEPLTLTATQLGFDKIWDVSNAITISGGELIPCGVAITSGDDTIYGVTTLPSTKGNLTGTYYLTVTGV